TERCSDRMTHYKIVDLIQRQKQTRLWDIKTRKVENIISGFDGTTTNVTSYALAFYSCMWAYGGWYVTA
ncbi:hypothetical protein CHS0354_021904, partial [Potamilus streckersoni]